MRETAAGLKRPNKIYVPALDRFFGFFDSPDGCILLLSFYAVYDQITVNTVDLEIIVV